MRRSFLLGFVGAAFVAPVACGGTDSKFGMVPSGDAGTEGSVGDAAPDAPIGTNSDATADAATDGGADAASTACGSGCMTSQRCDELTDTCVECLFDFDCAANEQCTAEHTCEAVVPCANSLDCREAEDDQTICDETISVCVECATTADCGDRGQCVDQVCDGSTSCETTADCDEGVCDEQSERCVACLENDDCEEGEACVRNECQPSYECTSDNDCTAHDLLCDQAAGACVTCRRHSDCPALYHCSEGDCLLDVCESGQTSCQEGAVVTCGAIGDAFTDPDPCPEGSVCRVSGRDATCVSSGDAAVPDGGGSADAGDAAAPDAPNCTDTFYRDADGDGFGDPTAAVTACAAPEGYVEDSSDCYDGNAAAKPGQTAFFAEDRGDGSFDYDCVGGQTERWLAVGSCGSFPLCTAVRGWLAVPECGEPGSWITECPGLTAICGQETEERTQQCR